MKKSLLFWVSALGLLFAMGSCKIEKRLYQPGYHVEWKKVPSKKSESQLAMKEAEEKGAKSAEATDSVLVSHVQSEIENGITASTENGITEGELQTQLIDWPVKTQKNPKFIQDDCETLVLTDGRKLQVIVLEIAQREIRYKKCDMPDGPTVIVDKADVDRVIYANGAEDIISGYSAPQSSSGEHDTQNTASGKKMEVLALLSMIFGIIGLFIAGIPLGIAALILSVISLTKFANNPGKFGGKGMAIAGMILGFVAIIGALLFIASMAA